MFSLFSKIWQKAIVLPTGAVFNLKQDSKFQELVYFKNEPSVFCLIDPSKHNIFYATTCRELFSSHLEPYFAEHGRAEGFLFGFKVVSGMNVAMAQEFFNFINSKLPQDAQITFYQSNAKDLLVFHAPAFWSKTVFRHAMLSLLVRLGCFHYKGDLDKAIANYDLATQIKPTILLFLNGFFSEKETRVSTERGLVYYYRNLTTENAEKLLVKNA